MLATRVRQRHAAFYQLAVPAADLLRRVRFTCRFHDDLAGASVGERLTRNRAEDPVAGFIAAVQGSDSAFQRPLASRKIKQLREFYRHTELQPLIPGAIQLYATETLAFTPVHGEDYGDLAWPDTPFLVIDGQHRLAALHFHLEEHPDEVIQVPCTVFDGQHEDFAAEMFVTINSTPTRINRSHLVELYERIQETGDPGRKLAARLCRTLYEADDSPLQYRINRLGGRSAKDKWILQAEVFNELQRGLKADPDLASGRIDHAAVRHYAIVRDALVAARTALKDGWDQPGSAVCTPTVLKALLRLANDLARADREDGASPDGRDGDGTRQARWKARLAPLAGLLPELRQEGLYVRFPAKGPVERVAMIHKALARAAGLKNGTAGRKTDGG